MEKQTTGSEGISISAAATPLLFKRNRFVAYQAKPFPIATAFRRLCLSGNTGRLLLIFNACLAIQGCSTALITAGVLDRPAQERMFSAVDRAGLEVLAKKPIPSMKDADGRIVDVYSYIDGEAKVFGKSHPNSMRRERLFKALATALTGGYLEVFMVPTALYERSRATRQFYVVYTPDNLILAICWPNCLVDVPGHDPSLCYGEPKP